MDVIIKGENCYEKVCEKENIIEWQKVHGFLFLMLIIIMI